MAGAPWKGGETEGVVVLLCTESARVVLAGFPGSKNFLFGL